MEYEDWRGWRYKVMQGLGESNFKTRYKKPDSRRWRCVTVLPWRKTAEEAEADLAEYAKKHDMRRVRA